EVKHLQYMVFTFSIFFTLLGNAYYLFTTQKGKIMKAGGSITHIGFGLMLLGILLSGYKKEVISLDTTGITRNWDFGKETFEENYKESRENVLIFRNTTVPMGPYMVTYLGDSVAQTDPPLTFFKVRYERRHPETNELQERFILYPEAYVNPKGQQGLSANPDAKHYWTHDVFTYITSMSDPEAKTDTSSYRPFTVKNGDSIFLASGYIVFEGLNNKVNNPAYAQMPGDVAAEAKISAYDVNGKIGESKPVYYIRG